MKDRSRPGPVIVFRVLLTVSNSCMSLSHLLAEPPPKIAIVSELVAAIATAILL